jgi:hypothetical protein
MIGRRLNRIRRYAYFHNLPQQDLPYIKIPLHTLIKLTPKAYGCDEERCVGFVWKQNSLSNLPTQIQSTDRGR